MERGNFALLREGKCYRSLDLMGAGVGRGFEPGRAGKILSFALSNFAALLSLPAICLLASPFHCTCIICHHLGTFSEQSIDSITFPNADTAAAWGSLPLIVQGFMRRFGLSKCRQWLH